MKQLDLSAIASGIRFPFKKGTGIYLQQSWQELFAAMIIETIGILYYDPTTPYILYGCNQTPLGGTTRFEEGAIFFNGEIFYSPFQLISDPVGPDVFIANILTTQYTTDADPVIFSDSVARNVHNDRTVQYTVGLTTTGTIGDYDNFEKINDFSEDVTLGSGFTNLATYNNAGYKIQGADVELCGTITGTLGGATTTLLTLPPRARPLTTGRVGIVYVDASSMTMQQLLINTDGTIDMPTSSSSVAFIFLDGIKFRRF